MATLIVTEDLAAPATLGRGGQTMHVLQWLHGFRRLGHRVLFVEFLKEDPGGEPGCVSAGRAAAIRYFREVMETWWDPEWSALLMADTGESLYGLEAGAVGRLAHETAALITLAAHYRRDPYPLVDRIRPRILVEQDPGYTHLWASESDPLDIYGEHDIYFTVGTNVGTTRCELPTFGLEWLPMWYPVVLDWWPTGQPITRDRFTTIADWRGYGYLEFEGAVLGPKAEEFRKFISLPRLAGEPLEICILIDPNDPDVDYLKSHGWLLEDTKVVASPELYQEYLAGSAGEFSCTKGGYVGTHSGWFSDRSANYLAAGRPVVLQATGFEDLLPTGRGLFAVSTPQEAAEAIQAVRRDYGLHSAAARELACEFFDCVKIAGRVLAEAGIEACV